MSDTTTDAEKLRRRQALHILEGLARRLQSLTADFFYIELQKAGFDENERAKFVGACFRTAQKNHWLERTNYSQKSIRNHSNLLSVWVSKVYSLDATGGQVPKAEIDAEYAKWANQGIQVPDKFAKLWQWQTAFTNGQDGENLPARSPTRIAGLF